MTTQDRKDRDGAYMDLLLSFDTTKLWLFGTMEMTVAEYIRKHYRYNKSTKQYERRDSVTVARTS